MGDKAKRVDVERLIAEVTEKVVSSIEAQALGARSGATGIGSATARQRDAAPLSSSRRRPRSLLFLLPVPSPKLAKLADLAGSLALDGWQLHALAGDALSLEAAAGMLSWPELSPLAGTSVSSLLETLRPGDAMVLGTLGFGLASRLSRLEDDDPFVRLIVSARLAGIPVLVLQDDLEPAPGTAGEIPRRAAELLREIERLGLEVLPAKDLETRLAQVSQSRSVGARGVGSLLTESEIERLHASGERRLILAPRTLVTPLARSRASEIGLELIEKGTD